jgi:hypothetical protein
VLLSLICIFHGRTWALLGSTMNYGWVDGWVFLACRTLRRGKKGEGRRVAKVVVYSWLIYCAFISLLVVFFFAFYSV